MSNRAWVTLATNDSYGLGALVLAHSLRRANTAHPAVALITPSVTEAMSNRLRAVFSEVILVDVLDSKDATHLALLQRPELGITFTKIHCWSLIQYEKCVFLDADTLIIQNCDELFDREELSAAPDVGWPDCFNSGVFVYRPSQETFEKIIKFAQERGSFDGGDQGLLNAFFSDWAHGDINKHLPFLYNVTSAAFYSYLPALKHYGQDLKIIHFIGAVKPWLQQFNWQSRTVQAPEHLRELLQLWWDLFVGQVHSQLETTMTGVAGNLARVVPGAIASQSEALDELTRRQGWEAGNIDYMGADSFDNIWAKISQTLQRSSPPKQSPSTEPSVPKEASLPSKEATPPKSASPPKEVLSPLEELSPGKATPSKQATPPKQETPSKQTTPPKQATPPKQSSPPKQETSPKQSSPPKQETPPKQSSPLKQETPPKQNLTPKQDSSTKEDLPQIQPSVKPTEDVSTKPSPPVELAKEATAIDAPPPQDVPITAETLASEVSSPKLPDVAERTDKPASVPPTPPGTPKSITPEATPVSGTPPKAEDEKQTTLVESVESQYADAPSSPQSTILTSNTSASSVTSSESPPLANTPSKEEAPVAPSVKSTEEAVQETRL